MALVLSYTTMTGWPWTAALMASTLWIIYRVYMVFQKPVQELEELLGIDIPPAPEIALSTIGGTSVLLYWKSPENYHSSLRHTIQVNGITVEEFDRPADSINVTGLQPGNYYGIRAIATNTGGNSSYSRLIRVQTTPPGGHRGMRLLASPEQGGTKRHVPARRISHPISATKASQAPPAGDAGTRHDSECEETVAELTRKLDSLRMEKEELERQVADESEEFEQSRAALARERDELKKVVDDKEKQSLEFKKQVNELEKQCKASQREKSRRERTLQQKKAERQKMRDESGKWASETVQFKEDTEALRQKRKTVDEEHARKMVEGRKAVEQIHRENKHLEEQLRELGTKVKDLEAERKKADREQNEEEQEAARREEDEQQAHEIRVNELQQAYRTMWNMFASAQAEVQQAQERLEYLQELQSREPHRFAFYNPVDRAYTMYGGSPWMSRQSSSLTGSGHYAPPIQYPGGLSSFAGSSSLARNNVPSFPFYSAADPRHRVALDDLLSPSGPMSPSANALLPSDLFAHDDAQIFQPPEPLSMNVSSFRPPSTDLGNADPASPLSVHSHSPSMFSSPQESIANAPNFYSTRDSLIDSDRQSLGSTHSPFAAGLTVTASTANPRRFSNLFGFNKGQRGKATSMDSPTLGSLSRSQSQSFPLDLDSDPSGAGSGRRKHGTGIWSTGILGRSTGTSGEGDATGAGPSSIAPRRGRRGIFGSKLDPTDPLDPLLDRSSPRPGSTYSYEQPTQRSLTDGGPSGNSQASPWHSLDSGRARGSPLGTWSQSRRQSLQHGSTSNLSLGTTPLDPEPIGTRKAAQPAPIGTGRKAAKLAKIEPKLNPAAPSFTGRLFSRAESRKTPKHDKEKPQDGLKHHANASASASDPNLLLSDDSSPSASRTSRDLRDGRSIMTSSSIGGETVASSSLSHDGITVPSSVFASTAGGSSTLLSSLEPSTSTLGSTPSEVQLGTSAASSSKESFMQRLTRKSSSSKFSVPWGKPFAKSAGSGGSRALGEPSTPSGFGGGDDYNLDEAPGVVGGNGGGFGGGDGAADAGGDYVGKGREGSGLLASGQGTSQGDRARGAGGTAGAGASSGGSLSWSRVMGMGKKGRVEEGTIGGLEGESEDE